MKANIKTPLEIASMRKGGRILATTLETLAVAVRPGMTTGELNELAEQLLRKSGATASFLNYGQESGNPFPATLCTSVNSTVVHGIPLAQVVLKEGDIIG